MANQLAEHIEAIIFDLDGVITDTAEYHFRSWKRLADEEGFPFSRAANEQLRGVSRRESLNLILAQASHDVAEEAMVEMMTRKNRYYNEMITGVSSADLLPGVRALLEEIRQAGIKIAIASASRNAPLVVERLGIQDYLDTLTHGGSVQRQKPAPDLFLHTARQLDVAPAACIVVEDAAAGIEAARAAGMVAVGIGPAERVGVAEVIIPNLEGVTLADLTHAATWHVAEMRFEDERQHHRETIFTTGNGYLSTRGAFEEGYPGDRPATLVHGMWDDVPLAFTEIANAPCWATLEIWVNDFRFDMTQNGIEDFARYLDLQEGVLRRRLRWTTPDGAVVDLSFERFTSLADEHTLALRVEAVPVNRDADIRVRALLDSHVENEGFVHWNVLSQQSTAQEASLLIQTRHSKMRLAMSARLDCPGSATSSQGVDCPGTPGVMFEVRREAGEALNITKLVAVYSSRDSENPLAAAREKVKEMGTAGYDSLLAANVAAWRRFWEASDVLIEGDDEAQTALRHALYQLRIAAPTHDERVSIGAKTLSGFGYRGHVFWDTEIFVLPFFSYTQPELARNMLMYRYHTLPGARRKAAANGYRGAQYAWESAETGDEVTPTWLPHFEDPTRLVRIWTGDIELHISSDVAYAARQYWRVSGDDDFWRDHGAAILLETALFWGDCVQPEGDVFVVRDVVGPDEYHEHVDNNIYTNYIIRWHLQTALGTLDWLRDNAPQKAAEYIQILSLTEDVLAHWRDVIDNILILQDAESGLMEQFEGFFNLEDVDWPAYAERTRSMQAILGIDGANKAKVLKQPDAIALLALFGEAFEKKTWHANWDYYAPITDHSYGSSLGPAMHAWVAARVGKIDEAYDHFVRAARADLHDVRGNAGDGIHAASAGGLWQAVVFGFAGLHIADGEAAIQPLLPQHWNRLAFHFCHRGKTVAVDITQKGGEMKRMS